MAEFLTFLAAVARAQQRAVTAIGAPSMPDLSAARVHGMPLLPRVAPTLDPLWRKALAAVLDAMADQPAPEPARAALARLRAEGPDDLDPRAQRFLAGVTPATELADSLFVVSALQVAWTAKASALDPTLPQTLDPPGRCPVCGSPPVAGVTLAAQPLEGVRYLCCELCATHWHFPRAQCTQCQSEKDVAYLAFAEQETKAVRAEACAGCKTYLKVFAEEKAPGCEPFVDDLASLGLDLRLTEEGWHRPSPHPFLLIGSG